MIISMHNINEEGEEYTPRPIEVSTSDVDEMLMGLRDALMELREFPNDTIVIKVKSN